MRARPTCSSRPSPSWSWAENSAAGPPARLLWPSARGGSENKIHPKPASSAASGAVASHPSNQPWLPLCAASCTCPLLPGTPRQPLTDCPADSWGFPRQWRRSCNSPCACCRGTFWGASSDDTVRYSGSSTQSEALPPSRSGCALLALLRSDDPSDRGTGHHH